MKIIFVLIPLALCAFPLHAQKRTINVGSFTDISFGIAGTVYLTQGKDEEVTIDCSESVFEKIEIEQKGDRLMIGNKEKWSRRNNIRKSDVDVYITMKEINRMALSGSGTINGENKLNTEDLLLSISGSGDMNLDVSSQDMEIKISGSGGIALSGKAEDVQVKISGSGKVKAEDLGVKTFEATISGSGSCYITVSEEINARISGSGNIYYKGDPDRVISNSSGSGKVRKM